MQLFNQRTWFLAILITSLSLGSGCNLFRGSQDVSIGKAAGKKSKPLNEKQKISLERTFVNANKEKILGNYADARQLFKECLKIDPTHHPSMYEIARLDLKMNNYDEALHYAKKAISYDEENKWYQQTLAKALRNKGQYEQAAQIYEKLVEQNPNNYEFYLDWAFMLANAQKWEASVKVYDKLEKKIGVNPEITKQKQKLYLQAGKFDKAVEEVRSLIKEYPDNIEYKLLLADLYEANDYSDKAMEVYEEVLQEDSTNTKAQLALADQYKKEGNREAYISTLKGIFGNPDVNIDKKVKILVQEFGLLEQKSTKTPEGVTLSKSLVEAHSENAKAYSIYGDFLYQNDELEKALDQYHKAIELDNSKFSLWRQALVIEAELQKYEALIEDADKALSYFPNQPTIYYFKSIGLIQKKRYEAVISSVKQGLALQPQNDLLKAQMYANLGEAHYQLKNYASSDSSFEQAIELDPENTYVLNNYSYYLSKRGEKLDKAAQLAKKANELEPDNSSFQDTYGWVLYRQGNYEEAKKWIEKAMDNGGDQRPVIVEHYGDVLFKLGDKEKAVEYWKKAKSLGAKSGTIDKKIADEKLYK